MTHWATRAAVALMTGARRGSLIAAAVATVIFFASLVAGQVLDAKTDDCSGEPDCPGLWAAWDAVYIALAASLFALIVSVASWLTLFFVKRSGDRRRANFVLRSHSHRDWFVFGRITRPQHAKLKAAFDPLTSDAGFDAGRAAGAWLIAIGSVTIVLTGPVWAAMIDFGNDEGIGFVTVVWTILTVVTLSAAAGLVIGVLTASMARKAFRATASNAEAVEERVLASIGKS